MNHLVNVKFHFNYPIARYSILPCVRIFWDQFNRRSRSFEYACYLNLTLDRIQNKSLIPSYIEQGFESTKQQILSNGSYYAFEQELLSVPQFPPIFGKRCVGCTWNLLTWKKRFRCPPSCTVLQKGCITLEQLGYDPNHDLVWINSLNSLKRTMIEVQEPGVSLISLFVLPC